jgi:hypothetical protein
MCRGTTMRWRALEGSRIGVGSSGYWEHNLEGAGLPGLLLPTFPGSAVLITVADTVKGI